MGGGAHRSRATDEQILTAVPPVAAGREARVGVFVLLGLLSFIVVLFLMTDPATLRGRYMLVTTVENAGGVRSGDPVQMRGVNIGRIHSFEMERNGRVAITMELDGQWKIPQGSHTKLAGAGVFGGRTMELVPGSGPGTLQPGDTIPGEGGGGGLMGSIDQLGGQATTLLDSIQSLLNHGTVSSVRGSAGQLDTLLTELSGMVREQRSTLKSLTASLSRSASGLEHTATGPDVARTVARADSAMVVLTQTGRNLDDASTSLRELLARIDRGEGTLGRLSKDDSLYVNLNRAAASVASLMDDVKAHPKKYINVSIF
jgi:phospholipid/cholesterol/gamma-HCH transport system substrate-binding protein